jgi:hypothetical protein
MILTTILAILSKIKNFTVKHWKQLLLVGLGAFLALKVQGCAHKLFPPKKPVSGPSSPATGPVLPKNDREEIIVTPNKTTVVTSSGTQTVTGTRGATIDVTNNGKIIVKEKTHGFVLNPMLGIAVNNTGLKGVVGTEVYFYKKLDLIVGLGADKYISHTSGFVAIGYTPQNKFFHNTSFWIGPSIDLNNTKSIIAGVAVRI